jgi:hypothetical protein
VEATLLMGGNKTRNYELRRIEKSVEKDLATRTDVSCEKCASTGNL